MNAPLFRGYFFILITHPMKRICLVSCLALILLSTSCRNRHHHNGGYLSIKVSENDQYYSMNASFNKNKMDAVNEYMDEHIGRRNGVSFSNTKLDATFTMDDHTLIYIKSDHPGELII